MGFHLSWLRSQCRTQSKIVWKCISYCYLTNLMFSVQQTSELLCTVSVSASCLRKVTSDTIRSTFKKTRGARKVTGTGIDCDFQKVTDECLLTANTWIPVLKRLVMELLCHLHSPENSMPSNSSSRLWQTFSGMLSSGWLFSCLWLSGIVQRVNEMCAAQRLHGNVLRSQPKREWTEYIVQKKFLIIFIRE